jgi:type II secretory pathway pseudopilin PulG
MFMIQRLLLYLWKARRLARAGFTIAELVIGATIGVILLTGMMYLVVEMTRVERTQTARGETEREMAQALDYIAAELREAVLVYDRNCLGATGTGNGSTCPGLTLPTNTVLAFWKREPVPDSNFLANVQGDTDQEKIDRYARDNACVTNRDCNAVMNYVRTQYTLVVYVLCPNLPGRPGPKCEPNRGFKSNTGTEPRGPARIMRGYFRQYVWGERASDFENRLRVSDFQNLDPLESPTWPASIPSWNDDNANSEILISNVDWEPPRVNVNCPAGYVSTTGVGQNTGFRSFFACVRERRGVAETGFVQDVYVYLRGNAADRAGLREIESSGTNIYRPAVETYVRTRGSYNRRPT